MPTTKRQTSQVGSGCLIVFALPFTAVGLGMFAWLTVTFCTYLGARHWVETPARILRTDLKVHRGNKSNTYEVTAQYSYTFGGRKYSGDRVGLVPGGNGTGSFPRQAYRELSDYQRSRKPFRCYVNPARPQNAVLYRDLHWELAVLQVIFVLAFGGIGLGLLAGGIAAYRKQRAEIALAAAHPDEPWNWRADWVAGRIVASLKRAALTLLILATFWNLVTAPLWIILPGEILRKRNYWSLLGLALPTIGLLLLAWAIYAILRWRKFGQSVFQMANVPGAIGGQLAGVVQTSAKVRPEDGFHLTLRCLRYISTGAGKQRRTEETVVWEEKQTVMHELLEDQYEQSAIPVVFQIPGDCRPTDMQNPNDQTVWRLIAAAKVPGIDYSARFEVPVFNITKDSA